MNLSNRFLNMLVGVVMIINFRLQAITPDKETVQVKNNKRIHIVLGGALVQTKANNDIMDAFQSSGFKGTQQNWLFRGTIKYPDDDTTPVGWYVVTKMNISPKLRIGINFVQFSSQRIQGPDLEEENAVGKSIGLLAEFLPSPKGSIFPAFQSRFEFAFRGGVNYAFTKVDGSVSGLFGIAIEDATVPFEIKKNLIGAQVGIGLDYYFAKWISLQLKVDGRLYPSIDVDEVKFVNPNNQEEKILKAHSVNFSSIDIGFGIVMHF